MVVERVKYLANGEERKEEDILTQEHITNNGFILTNFRKNVNGVTKSANKNQSADIKIDRKGNLTLVVKSGELIISTNVIAARNVAWNLLSLRKFANMGLSIHLDNEKIRVYNSSNDETFLIGNYIKPNYFSISKLGKPRKL